MITGGKGSQGRSSFDDPCAKRAASPFASPVQIKELNAGSQFVYQTINFLEVYNWAKNPDDKNIWTDNSWYSSSVTIGFHSCNNDASRTVIATADPLNEADVAIEILGEYYRRVKAAQGETIQGWEAPLRIDLSDAIRKDTHPSLSPHEPSWRHREEG
jgi:hypothetical protein